MKKTLAFIALTALAVPTFAKRCSLECNLGTVGNVTTLMSYHWEQPNNSTCGKAWLADHENTTVRFTHSIRVNGRVSVIERGELEHVTDIQC